MLINLNGQKKIENSVIDPPYNLRGESTCSNKNKNEQMHICSMFCKTLATYLIKAEKIVSILVQVENMFDPMSRCCLSPTKYQISENRSTSIHTCHIGATSASIINKSLILGFNQETNFVHICFSNRVSLIM